VRAQGQSLLRLDDTGHVLGDETSVVPGEPEVDVDLLRQLLGRCDAVLVSDYGGPLTRDPAVRSSLAAFVADVPVVWDPHPRGGDPIAGAALCTPNRAEARHFVAAAGPPGADLSAADLPDQAAALQRHWRARAVCVTDGERGAVTAMDDGELAVSRALPCPDGVDTCGAGDRFSAGVAIALGRAASPFSAVAEAHVDVGQWLTDGGVGGIVLDEVDAHRDIGRRDVGVSADEVVERVRARGGTVVATGGCFDVLHAGHLALLEQARALGDCLVVLLNSDASVRRIKGASRPVHSAADRGRLFEGLACVDAVVVFEDDDPTATLARLRPDVWVKGGDYRDQDLPEARTVRALGGRIALVPYLDGHSSTRILQRLESSGSRVTRTPSTTAMTDGGR
jgi:rfaE bifunctional protein nucleotidyltransferase chain/domain